MFAMLRAQDGSDKKGESFCLDGDIKRIAGLTQEATVAYLHGYVVDPQHTQLHLLDTLTTTDKENIIELLLGWVKNETSDMLRKRFAGLKNASNAIWKFIFMLNPQSVDSCINEIERQMKEKRFRQVVDACTAIIDYSNGGDTTEVLVQRAIAYTLMDGFNKSAVSDCLGAFARDKEKTMQVLRNKHGAHFPHVSELLRAVVYSQPVGKENQKNEKWLKLTTDCCKLLLAMDANNFILQMTFVERLTGWNKLDQATATLNEIIRELRQDPYPDARKLAECWIRLGYCCFIKPHIENAVTNITRGLNFPIDFLIEEEGKSAIKTNNQTQEYDITKTFLEDNYEVQNVGRIARDVFNGEAASINDIFVTLEKAAARLYNSEKSSVTIKLNTNIQQAIDFYRAMLVLKPKQRDTLLKLASCYSKNGRHNFAIKIYDNLLSRKDYAQDSVILSARAVCYREIGKKNEARKDYDTLLRHTPKDPVLLFERSLVHLENADIDSLLIDLEAACKSNQRTVSIYMKKLPLAQQKKIREMLYDRAANLLQYARPPLGESEDTSVVLHALSITQLLTKLNSKDHAAHILKAHALYYAGMFEDAEVTLKRLLSSNPENSDNHIIKLHLGLLRILMNQTDKGVTSLVKVLGNSGDKLFATFIRDLSASERAWLHPAVHTYAVSMLKKTRDNSVVEKAISCFTIAILCCSEDPAHSAELPGSQGLRKSYLARAECYAHIGDQRNAIFDFTSALEVNPTCIAAICGRAFMKLALGDEVGCVNDIVQACGIAMPSVTAHITVLPQDAKRILLHWLDQQLITLLLAHASNDKLMHHDRRASTVSITVETGNLIGFNTSPLSDSTVPSEVSSPDVNHYNVEVHREDSVETTESNWTLDESPSDDSKERSTSSVLGSDKSDTSFSPSDQRTSTTSSITEGILRRKRRGFHKSSADIRNLNTSSTTKISMTDEINTDTDSNETSSLVRSSRPATTFTTQTSVSCDDVISGVEKTERLIRAQIIGKLLIAVDPANPLHHGKYADIFILKGEYQKSLQHLQMVMQLCPTDVTAVARAGLIYAKQGQYQESANSLSSLTEIDVDLLLYVLKKLDSTMRRRLSQEAHRMAVIMIEEGDFIKSVEYFGLSVVASSDHKRLEKLRLRALCFVKMGDNRRALDDMNSVIKDAGSNATAMDYCSRGHIFLLDNKDKEACLDYSKALKIDKKQACLHIHSKPGLSPLSRVFHRQALEEFIGHGFEQCLNLCDDGIMIDSSNIDLRKLRARARKEVVNCIVQ